MGLDHGASFGVLLDDSAARFLGIEHRVDDDIGEMQRVVVFQLLERGTADIGEFIFLPLSGNGFDKKECQYNDDHRQHQHVKQVLDKGVFFEEVFVHNRVI